MESSTSSSATSLLLSAIGIVLIFAAGAYAIYERYAVRGTHFSALALNPIVDGLGIAGVIVLIAGAAVHYKTRNRVPLAGAALSN
jgi:hypothetical protein